MSETCEKCGRPRPLRNATCVDVYATCSRPGSSGCLHATAGKRVGLREGFAIAQRNVNATAAGHAGGYRIDFDWTEAEAALEAAVRGGG